VGVGGSGEHQARWSYAASAVGRRLCCAVRQGDAVGEKTGVGVAPETQANVKALLQRMSGLGRSWQDSGCQEKRGVCSAPVGLSAAPHARVLTPELPVC